MAFVALATWRTPNATAYPTFPVYYCASFYEYNLDLAMASAFAAKLNSSRDFFAACNSTTSGGFNSTTNDTAYLRLVGDVYSSSWMDRDAGEGIVDAVGNINAYLTNWINTTYKADLLTVAATYNRRLTASNSSNGSLASIINSGTTSSVETANTETFAPTTAHARRASRLVFSSLQNVKDDKDMSGAYIYLGVVSHKGGGSPRREEEENARRRRRRRSRRLCRARLQRRRRAARRRRTLRPTAPRTGSTCTA